MPTDHLHLNAKRNTMRISNNVSIPEQEIELNFIRSQGAGGQNVNKVASAVHLRFNIHTSSLPENYKQRLISLKDSRISKEGILVIKAQQYRSQEKNREDALFRMKTLITQAMQENKKRKPTRPGKSARKKRTDTKKQRGQLKSTRKKVRF